MMESNQASGKVGGEALKTDPESSLLYAWRHPLSLIEMSHFRLG